MRTQVFGYDAVIGKTIAQIIPPIWGPTVIVFTDGTFAQLTIEQSGEGETTIAWDRPLQLLDFPDVTLIEAGIMTQQELDVEKARYEQERQQTTRDDRHRKHEHRRHDAEPEA